MFTDLPEKKIGNKDKMPLHIPTKAVTSAASSAASSAATAASKDIAKDVAKDASKAASGSAGQTAAMAALATMPIIGTTLTTIFAANSAAEVVDTLVENPMALAVIGGLVILIFFRK